MRSCVRRISGSSTRPSSAHDGIEYFAGAHQSFWLGDSQTQVDLPSGQSYSSFILIPLLNFAVRRRCLLVGGRGRGKTASAVLTGVLAGYSVTEIRRGMQHGHPEMTVADLLGNPLPIDLINATTTKDIRIAWRAATNAGLNRGRMQQDSRSNTVGTVDAHGRRLRRDVRSGASVSRGRLVPDGR
jgi:hypothetical protein